VVEFLNRKTPDFMLPYLTADTMNIFTRESSYCFQHILTITILSIRLSVCHTGGSVKNAAS